MRFLTNDNYEVYYEHPRNVFDIRLNIEPYSFAFTVPVNELEDCFTKAVQDGDYQGALQEGIDEIISNLARCN